MDRTWILHGHLSSPSYINGVQHFMGFVRAHEGHNLDVYCPCCTCMNGEKRPQHIVEDHLHIFGMDRTYVRWVYHGEPYDDPLAGEADIYHPDHLGQAGEADLAHTVCVLAYVVNYLY